LILLKRLPALKKGAVAKLLFRGDAVLLVLGGAELLVEVFFMGSVLGFSRLRVLSNGRRDIRTFRPRPIHHTAQAAK
jgi:hypothetical protein